MNPAIEVIGLCKSYADRQAVTDLSFRVMPGEAVALLGPNGSGKTTTLRCIAGLVQPDSGQVLIDGLRLHASSLEARKRFSYLPQEAVFAGSLTSSEIILFHAALRGVDRERAFAALKEAGVNPEDWERPVRTFSGGMRHRLSLAVAGLAPVSVMLLDEPTANLDPRAALKLREMALKWRGEGRALLFSTHVLTDVEELADRVIVLVDGRPVAQESVEALRADIRQFAELRIDVGLPTEAHLQAALAAGATDARLNSHSVLVTAPVERRLAILHSIGEVSPVNHFESEPLSVERIYLSYVSHEKNN